MTSPIVTEINRFPREENIAGPDTFIADYARAQVQQEQAVRIVEQETAEQIGATALLRTAELVYA